MFLLMFSLTNPPLPHVQKHPLYAWGFDAVSKPARTIKQLGDTDNGSRRVAHEIWPRKPGGGNSDSIVHHFNQRPNIPRSTSGAHGPTRTPAVLQYDGMYI